MATAEAMHEPERLKVSIRGGRRKILIIVAPALLLGVAAGVLWFTGMLPHMLGLDHRGATAAAAAPAAPVFVDLPEMVTNLNGGPRRSSYVKMKAQLEVSSPADVALIKDAMPRIQDLFQTYLREMHPEELRSTAGTYRLREELIARADLAAPPARVVDVLFSEIIVQ